MKIDRIFGVAATGVLAVSALAACGGGSPETDAIEEAEAPADSADGADAAAPEPAEGAGEADSPADDPEGESAGDTAELFTGELHEVEIPAPNSGWFEIDGARTELEEVTCAVQVESESPRIVAQVNSADTEYGPVTFKVSKSVLKGASVPVEAVHVLVEEGERGSGTLAEGWLRVEPDGANPVWMRGESKSPAILIRDDAPHYVLTSAGTLEAGDNGDELVTGDFTAALTCGDEEG